LPRLRCKNLAFFSFHTAHQSHAETLSIKVPVFFCLMEILKRVEAKKCFIEDDLSEESTLALCFFKKKSFYFE
jgi:hypothetical protein